MAPAALYGGSPSPYAPEGELWRFFGTVKEGLSDLANTIMTCGCCTTQAERDPLELSRRRWLGQAGGEDESAAVEALLEAQALREIRSSAPPTVRLPSPVGLTDEELAKRLQDEDDESYARESAISLERARRALALRGAVEHRSDGAYTMPVSYERPEDTAPPPPRARHAPPNADQRAALFRRLPTRSFHAAPWRQEGDDDESHTCQICLEGYREGDQLSALPCLHSFHTRCVGAWLQGSPQPTCPLCNVPLRIS
eukprot:tig00000581_g2224.t1